MRLARLKTWVGQQAMRFEGVQSVKEALRGRMSLASRGRPQANRLAEIDLSTTT
jgi:hypothetical protein